MKKLAVILASVFIIAAFTGCAFNSGGTDKPADSENAQQQAPKSSDSGKIGKYDVTIKDAKLTNDYKGSAALLVTFSFTNNSDSDASFATSVTDKAYQDGVELETAYSIGNESDYNAGDSLKYIKPGATLEVKAFYKLANETSDVLVEATDFLSLGSEKLSKTFVIKQ